MFKKLDRAIRDLNHRRIDSMRALKLSVAQAMVRIFKKTLISESTSAPILVFRLDDKIGDSITATGFLKELKKLFPTSRLIILSGQNASSIYQNLPFIDEVQVVRKGFVSSLKAYFKLANIDYRYLINTSHILSPQVVFLANFLIASRKITFLNQQDQTFSDHIDYDLHKDHVTKRYQNILRVLNVVTTDLDYVLRLPDSDSVKQAQLQIKQLHRQGKKVVILNSFAGARLRNFYQETTTDVVRGLSLSQNNLAIVSIGNQDDLSIVKKWIAESNIPEWISFSDTTLDFNLSLVKESDLVITPDTSLVHVASAFKKKLVAVYREDETHEKNSLIWAPYKTKCEVIYAPQDLTRPDDINSVDPKLIVEKALSLLSE